MGDHGHARNLFQDRNPDAPPWAADIAEALTKVSEAVLGNGDLETGLIWRVKQLEKFNLMLLWILGLVGAPVLTGFGVVLWTLISTSGTR